MTSACNPIYSRRKRWLPEYRKLFEVLLKIPDEDVRKRVIDAINGDSMCSLCKKKDTREFGTQTENIAETMCDLLQKNEEVPGKHEDSNNKQTFEKKRRKRKRTCPKVVKTAQLSNNTPVLKQDTTKMTQNEVPHKIIRQTEFEDIILETSIDSLVSNDSQNIETIRKQMKIEFETCFQFCDGLLPIHLAITKNDLKKLRRQLYVFEYLKKDLMELITDYDYNVIQLAVTYNCYKFIIVELLNQKTVHLKDVDEENNTIIHLAVTHLSCDNDMDQQQSMIETFELLLRKFDLQMLKERNNDGMTALHLAVRDGKYLMVETMLKVIDDIWQIRSAAPVNRSNPNEKAFLKHYSKQCDHFEGRKVNAAKSEILDATDMKGGCSALYFAMKGKYDHIIYLLLAHMCDPTVKNLAGIDPKTYYAEHGTNPGIGGTLDKVTQVLQTLRNS